MLDVAGHGDDFDGARAHPHTTADGRLRRKQPPGERLADDDARRRGRVVARVERPPGGNRNAHHIEIAWTSNPQDRFAVGLPAMYADKTAA